MRSTLVSAAIAANGHAMTGERADYDALLDLVGDRRFVGHPATKARFYGLDLRYSCFDHVGGEGQAYGYALAFSGAIPCENEVVAQLVELRRRADAYLRRDGWIVEDELFFAEQNARLMRDAEEYYKQMYRAEVSSWNLRDRHMAGTLDALVEHLDPQLPRAKVVVWEHTWAMLVPPGWAHAVSSTSGSSRGSVTAASVCWSGSPPSMAGHRCLRLGRPRRVQRARRPRRRRAGHLDLDPQGDPRRLEVAARECGGGRVERSAVVRHRQRLERLHVTELEAVRSERAADTVVVQHFEVRLGAVVLFARPARGQEPSSAPMRAASVASARAEPSSGT